MDNISFVNQTDLEILDWTKVAPWLVSLCESYGFKAGEISYLFCDDDYLLEINKQYLDHDTLTDIITFPYHALTDPIESDIYISIDRIQENAATFNIPFLTELKRVMIHGVLHLCGYGDKTEQEKRLMRTKEDFYLTKYEG